MTEPDLEFEDIFKEVCPNEYNEFGLKREMRFISERIIVEYDPSDHLSVREIMHPMDAFRSYEPYFKHELADKSRNEYVTAIDFHEHITYFPYAKNTGDVCLARYISNFNDTNFAKISGQHLFALPGETIYGLRVGRLDKGMVAVNHRTGPSVNSTVTVLDLVKPTRNIAFYDSIAHVNTIDWIWHSAFLLAVGDDHALRIMDVRCPKAFNAVYFQGGVQRTALSSTRPLEIACWDGTNVLLYDIRRPDVPCATYDIGLIENEKLNDMKFNPYIANELFIHTNQHRVFAMQINPSRLLGGRVLGEKPYDKWQVITFKHIDRGCTSTRHSKKRRELMPIENAEVPLLDYYQQYDASKADEEVPVPSHWKYPDGVDDTVIDRVNEFAEIDFESYLYKAVERVVASYDYVLKKPEILYQCKGVDTFDFVFPGVNGIMCFNRSDHTYKIVRSPKHYEGSINPYSGSDSVHFYRGLQIQEMIPAQTLTMMCNRLEAGWNAYQISERCLKRLAFKITDDSRAIWADWLRNSAVIQYGGKEFSPIGRKGAKWEDFVDLPNGPLPEPEVLPYEICKDEVATEEACQMIAPFFRLFLPDPRPDMDDETDSEDEMLDDSAKFNKPDEEKKEDEEEGKEEKKEKIEQENDLEKDKERDKEKEKEKEKENNTGIPCIPEDETFDMRTLCKCHAKMRYYNSKEKNRRFMYAPIGNTFMVAASKRIRKKFFGVNWQEFTKRDIIEHRVEYDIDNYKGPTIKQLIKFQRWKPRSFQKRVLPPKLITDSSSVFMKPEYIKEREQKEKEMREKAAKPIDAPVGLSFPKSSKPKVVPDVSGEEDPEKARFLIRAAIQLGESSDDEPPAKPTQPAPAPTTAPSQERPRTPQAHSLRNEKDDFEYETAEDAYFGIKKKRMYVVYQPATKPLALKRYKPDRLSEHTFITRLEHLMYWGQRKHERKILYGKYKENHKKLSSVKERNTLDLKLALTNHQKVGWQTFYDKDFFFSNKCSYNQILRKVVQFYNRMGDWGVPNKETFVSHQRSLFGVKPKILENFPIPCLSISDLSIEEIEELRSFGPDPDFVSIDETTIGTYNKFMGHLQSHISFEYEGYVFDENYEGDVPFRMDCRIPEEVKKPTAQYNPKDRFMFPMGKIRFCEYPIPPNFMEEIERRRVAEEPRKYKSFYLEDYKLPSDSARIDYSGLWKWKSCPNFRVKVTKKEFWESDNEFPVHLFDRLIREILLEASDKNDDTVNHLEPEFVERNISDELLHQFGFETSQNNKALSTKLSRIAEYFTWDSPMIADTDRETGKKFMRRVVPLKEPQPPRQLEGVDPLFDYITIDVMLAATKNLHISYIYNDPILRTWPGLQIMDGNRDDMFALNGSRPKKIWDCKHTLFEPPLQLPKEKSQLYKTFFTETILLPKDKNINRTRVPIFEEHSINIPKGLLEMMNPAFFGLFESAYVNRYTTTEEDKVRDRIELQNAILQERLILLRQPVPEETELELRLAEEELNMEEDDLMTTDSEESTIEIRNSSDEEIMSETVSDEYTDEEYTESEVSEEKQQNADSDEEQEVEVVSFAHLFRNMKGNKENGETNPEDDDPSLKRKLGVRISTYVPVMRYNPHTRSNILKEEMEERRAYEEAKEAARREAAGEVTEVVDVTDEQPEQPQVVNEVVDEELLDEQESLSCPLGTPTKENSGENSEHNEHSEESDLETPTNPVEPIEAPVKEPKEVTWGEVTEHPISPRPFKLHGQHYVEVEPDFLFEFYKYQETGLITTDGSEDEEEEGKLSPVRRTSEASVSVRSKKSARKRSIDYPRVYSVPACTYCYDEPWPTREECANCFPNVNIYKCTKIENMKVPCYNCGQMIYKFSCYNYEHNYEYTDPLDALLEEFEKEPEDQEILKLIAIPRKPVELEQTPAIWSQKFYKPGTCAVETFLSKSNDEQFQMSQMEQVSEIFHREFQWLTWRMDDDKAERIVVSEEFDKAFNRDADIDMMRDTMNTISQDGEMDMMTTYDQRTGMRVRRWISYAALATRVQKQAEKARYRKQLAEKEARILAGEVVVKPSLFNELKKKAKDKEEAASKDVVVDEQAKAEERRRQYLAWKKEPIPRFPEDTRKIMPDFKLPKNREDWLESSGSEDELPPIRSRILTREMKHFIATIRVHMAKKPINFVGPRVTYGKLFEKRPILKNDIVLVTRKKPAKRKPPPFKVQRLPLDLTWMNHALTVEFVPPPQQTTLHKTDPLKWTVPFYSSNVLGLTDEETRVRAFRPPSPPSRIKQQYKKMKEVEQAYFSQNKAKIVDVRKKAKKARQLRFRKKLYGHETLPKRNIKAWTIAARRLPLADNQLRIPTLPAIPDAERYIFSLLERKWEHSRKLIPRLRMRSQVSPPSSPEPYTVIKMSQATRKKYRKMRREQKRRMRWHGKSILKPKRSRKERRDAKKRETRSVNFAPQVTIITVPEIQKKMMKNQKARQQISLSYLSRYYGRRITEFVEVTDQYGRFPRDVPLYNTSKNSPFTDFLQVTPKITLVDNGYVKKPRRSRKREPKRTVNTKAIEEFAQEVRKMKKRCIEVESVPLPSSQVESTPVRTKSLPAPSESTRAPTKSTPALTKSAPASYSRSKSTPAPYSRKRQVKVAIPRSFSVDSALRQSKLLKKLAKMHKELAHKQSKRSKRNLVEHVEQRADPSSENQSESSLDNSDRTITAVYLNTCDRNHKKVKKVKPVKKFELSMNKLEHKIQVEERQICHSSTSQSKRPHLPRWLPTDHETGKSEQESESGFKNQHMRPKQLMIAHKPLHRAPTRSKVMNAIRRIQGTKYNNFMMMHEEEMKPQYTDLFLKPWHPLPTFRCFDRFTVPKPSVKPAEKKAKPEWKLNANSKWDSRSKSRNLSEYVLEALRNAKLREQWVLENAYKVEEADEEMEVDSETKLSGNEKSAENIVPSTSQVASKTKTTEVENSSETDPTLSKPSSKQKKVSKSRPKLAGKLVKLKSGRVIQILGSEDQKTTSMPETKRVTLPERLKRKRAKVMKARMAMWKMMNTDTLKASNKHRTSHHRKYAEPEVMSWSRMLRKLDKSNVNIKRVRLCNLRKPKNPSETTNDKENSPPQLLEIVVEPVTNLKSCLKQSGAGRRTLQFVSEPTNTKETFFGFGGTLTLVKPPSEPSSARESPEPTAFLHTPKPSLIKNPWLNDAISKEKEERIKAKERALKEQQLSTISELANLTDHERSESRSPSSPVTIRSQAATPESSRPGDSSDEETPTQKEVAAPAPPPKMPADQQWRAAMMARRFMGSSKPVYAQTPKKEEEQTKKDPIELTAAAITVKRSSEDRPASESKLTTKSTAQQILKSPSGQQPGKSPTQQPIESPSQPGPSTAPTLLTRMIATKVTTTKGYQAPVSVPKATAPLPTRGKPAPVQFASDSSGDESPWKNISKEKPQLKPSTPTEKKEEDKPSFISKAPITRNTPGITGPPIPKPPVVTPTTAEKPEFFRALFGKKRAPPPPPKPSETAPVSIKPTEPLTIKTNESKVSPPARPKIKKPETGSLMKKSPTSDGQDSSPVTPPGKMVKIVDGKPIFNVPVYAVPMSERRKRKEAQSKPKTDEDSDQPSKSNLKQSSPEPEEGTSGGKTSAKSVRFGQTHYKHIEDEPEVKPVVKPPPETTPEISFEDLADEMLREQMEREAEKAAELAQVSPSKPPTSPKPVDVVQAKSKSKHTFFGLSPFGKVSLKKNVGSLETSSNEPSTLTPSSPSTSMPSTSLAGPSISVPSSPGPWGPSTSTPTEPSTPGSSKRDPTTPPVSILKNPFPLPETSQEKVEEVKPKEDKRRVRPLKPTGPTLRKLSTDGAMPKPAKIQPPENPLQMEILEPTESSEPRIRKKYYTKGGKRYIPKKTVPPEEIREPTPPPPPEPEPIPEPEPLPAAMPPPLVQEKPRSRRKKHPKPVEPVVLDRMDQFSQLTAENLVLLRREFNEGREPRACDDTESLIAHPDLGMVKLLNPKERAKEYRRLKDELTNVSEFDDAYTATVDFKTNFDNSVITNPIVPSIKPTYETTQRKLRRMAKDRRKRIKATGVQLVSKRQSALNAVRQVRKVRFFQTHKKKMMTPLPSDFESKSILKPPKAPIAWFYRIDSDGNKRYLNSFGPSEWQKEQDDRKNSVKLEYTFEKQKKKKSYMWYWLQHVYKIKLSDVAKDVLQKKPKDVIVELPRPEYLPPSRSLSSESCSPTNSIDDLLESLNAVDIPLAETSKLSSSQELLPTFTETVPKRQRSISENAAENVNNLGPLLQIGARVDDSPSASTNNLNWSGLEPFATMAQDGSEILEYVGQEETATEPVRRRFDQLTRPISALFNALSGPEVAREADNRPTTERTFKGLFSRSSSRQQLESLDREASTLQANENNGEKFPAISQGSSAEDILALMQDKPDALEQMEESRKPDTPRQPRFLPIYGPHRQGSPMFTEKEILDYSLYDQFAELQEQSKHRQILEYLMHHDPENEEYRMAYSLLLSDVSDEKSIDFDVDAFKNSDFHMFSVFSGSDIERREATYMIVQKIKNLHERLEKAKLASQLKSLPKRELFKRTARKPRRIPVLYKFKRTCIKFRVEITLEPDARKKMELQKKLKRRAKMRMMRKKQKIVKAMKMLKNMGQTGKQKRDEETVKKLDKKADNNKKKDRKKNKKNTEKKSQKTIESEPIVVEKETIDVAKIKSEELDVVSDTEEKKNSESDYDGDTDEDGTEDIKLEWLAANKPVSGLRNQKNKLLRRYFQFSVRMARKIARRAVGGPKPFVFYAFISKIRARMRQFMDIRRDDQMREQLQAESADSLRIQSERIQRRKKVSQRKRASRKRCLPIMIRNTLKYGTTTPKEVIVNEPHFDLETISTNLQTFFQCLDEYIDVGTPIKLIYRFRNTLLPKKLFDAGKKKMVDPVIYTSPSPCNTDSDFSDYTLENATAKEKRKFFDRRSLESTYNVKGLPGLIYLARLVEERVGEDIERNISFCGPGIDTNEHVVFMTPVRRLMLNSLGLRMPDRVKGFHIMKRTNEPFENWFSKLFRMFCYGRGDLVRFICDKIALGQGPPNKKYDKMDISYQAHVVYKLYKKLLYIDSGREEQLEIFQFFKIGIENQDDDAEEGEELRADFKIDTYDHMLYGSPKAWTQDDWVEAADQFLSFAANKAHVVIHCQASILFMRMILTGGYSQDIIDQFVQMKLPIRDKLLFIINLTPPQFIVENIVKVFHTVRGLDRLPFVGLGYHADPLRVLFEEAVESGDPQLIAHIVRVGRCLDRRSREPMMTDCGSDHLKNRDFSTVFSKVLTNDTARRPYGAPTMDEMFPFRYVRHSDGTDVTETTEELAEMMECEVTRYMAILELTKGAAITKGDLDHNPKFNTYPHRFYFNILCTGCKMNVAKARNLGRLGRTLCVSTMPLIEQDKDKKRWPNAKTMSPRLTYENYIETLDPVENKMLMAKDIEEEKTDITVQVLPSRFGCFECRFSLPRCCICMVPYLNDHMDYSLKEYNERFSQFSICNMCNHGGHVNHIAEWFETEKYCPVAGCDCRCLRSKQTKNLKGRLRRHMILSANMRAKSHLCNPECAVEADIEEEYLPDPDIDFFKNL
ncbi:hypothetical protein L3Y34_011898 [Caenorhabditis briggsae]|uniref:GATOR2 complex protein MIO zinc-ribbon like domain-containing protein n=2 Tax=Caenorhabditis briggsae TaxID=6238 RepID=A0AAE8ZSK0_CAEBR|nr:hypothetical protein L3Y34_011898 [Caenorhabditis briggsae]